MSIEFVVEFVGRREHKLLTRALESATGLVIPGHWLDGRSARRLAERGLLKRMHPDPPASTGQLYFAKPMPLYALTSRAREARYVIR